MTATSAVQAEYKAIIIELGGDFPNSSVLRNHSWDRDYKSVNKSNMASFMPVP